MNSWIWTKKTAALCLGLSIIAACGGRTSQTPEEADARKDKGQRTVAAVEDFDSLVSVDWLNEHLDEPDLIVLDCNVKVVFDENGPFEILNGRADYEKGHIPGAGFADLTGDLIDTESDLMFAVPDPEEFAAAMRALGVGDDSRVVLYDQMASGWASRVWWMLRWIGFDRAAVLDGGLGAWKAAGYELTTELPERPAGNLTVSLRPELIAIQDDVRAAIGNEAVQLVDALPEASFRGDMVMYGRPGHIPGAVNVPAMAMIGETGRFLLDERLNEMFGLDKDSRVITYCGGGISASATAFIMTRLGYSDVAVYTASLQEWVQDPENPMEVVAE